MKTTDFITENQFIGDDAHAMHQDHEVQMARSDCYSSAKYAIELHKLLKNVSEMTGLDGWVSEKLTLANDYLRTVHEYLTHEMVHPEEVMPEMFTAESAEIQFAELLGETTGKQVDMTGKKCTACKKGTYQETEFHDDMDGALHCTKCNKKIKRHQPANPNKKGMAEDSPRQHPKRYQSAIDAWNRVMDAPESTPKDELPLRHNQTKNRIKNNTMAGPKGVLPESGVAEGSTEFNKIKTTPYKANQMLGGKDPVAFVIEVLCPDQSVVNMIQSKVGTAYQIERDDSIEGNGIGIEIISQRFEGGRTAQAAYKQILDIIKQSGGQFNDSTEVTIARQTQGVAEAGPGDVNRLEHRGEEYNVYFNQRKGMYTARGTGQMKGQIQPGWFHTLADAQDHAEMEIGGYDEHDGVTESDPLANRDAYAKQHQQGQVYKTHYPKGENPFHKAGMKDKRSTKMSAYDISNTGPKGQLPESGVAEGEKKGLYYNVNKRKAAGTSRPASNPKAPTDQAWKDAAKTAKTEGVSETTSSAGMATAPGVGKGPATGTLFGGSYAPRTPFTGKKKAKTSVIKR